MKKEVSVHSLRHSFATHSCSTVQGRGAGVGVDKGMLLVALGCGRLPGIFDSAESYPFVVFGTMEGEVFSGLTACVGFLKRK